MPTIEERFWAKVQRAQGCWPWVGDKTKDGYGHFRWDGRIYKRAHRIVYELLIGPIRIGLEIDHLCRNRICVNPEHLEAVSPHTNWERGFAITRLKAQQILCSRGHRLDIIRPNGGRDCSTCRNERSRTCYQGIKADPLRKAAKLERDNANRRRRSLALEAAQKQEVADAT